MLRTYLTPFSSHVVEKNYRLPRQTFCRSALLVAMGVALCSMGNAQTAHFTGAVHALGSGFNQPGGVAVDGEGNVFVTDFGNNAVYEIVAVNGSIPASPTIRTLASGFVAPTNVAVDAKRGRLRHRRQQWSARTGV